MRAIIADDEPILRHHLSRLLGAVSSDIDVVGCAKDGLEAIELAKTLQPDIVFLDIRMPGLDGMEVADAVNGLSKPPRIVFVTAYDHYAIEAFEHGAIDYLIKPIDEKRLTKTCNRLKTRTKPTLNPDELSQILTEAKEKQKTLLTWLKAAKGDDIHLIHVDDVEYFKAEDKYVTVCTKDAEYIIRTPLRNLSQMLCQETFWQIHRSVIVKVSAINRVFKDITGKMVVEVTSKRSQLPVSRSANALFKQM
ncbi:LytR/AlgR family response regulator transcription factor [Grimontia hollisae]|uniref:Probable transcriptional regulatory protein YehT n=1 Tax=Grimontia hollisae TaxID=673 RepID=A0A377J7Z4_GRIHO|nr:response regulator transcription factor [Grimontia hollisae]MDF2183942.1 response regulator transcription factor [Grimontia hollisae]STO98631.1 Probable transcriptional regulatory protein YehT [Grimontia hollisae]STQ76236.1 Probable transcriptional regulatory protein YehT [Grimontia hollisae]